RSSRSWSPRPSRGCWPVGPSTQCRRFPSRAASCTGAHAAEHSVLVTVTDHAAHRFLQRVRGTLEPKREVATRVARAHAAGRIAPGERGALLVRDLDREDLIYVCRPAESELIVITLWEQGEAPAVPKRFTDVLRRDDHLVGTRRDPPDRG